MITLPLTLADLMERVRHATGGPHSRAEGDLLVRGRCEHLGAPGTFLWRFGKAGRFSRELSGIAKRMVGGDENGTWILDGSGRARSLAWGEADQARLVTEVLSGDWLGPDTTIVPSLREDGALRLELGRREAALWLDSATFEPRRLELSPSFGIQNWMFTHYETENGVRFPHELEQHLPAGVVNRFHVERVSRAPADESAFAPPARATGSRFDPTLPSELVVERSPSGFLLVKPVLNGREAGWFIFDTGAGANVITPQAADALGLPQVGSGWLGLAAGASAGAVRRAEQLRLGPLTIADAALVELDLAAVSAASGVEIVGVLGYDVLMRALVEIEVEAGRIALYDPSAHEAPDVRWEPIVIYGNHVYVHARFEGHEGWFRLDTGAPQVPLVFNGPAVKRLDLLRERTASEAQIGVPGGTMRVAMGQISGLELAGHAFGPLAALFPLESAGAFADKETLGNLGQEVMRPFRALFDYARKRAAFLPR